MIGFELESESLTKLMKQLKATLTLDSRKTLLREAIQLQTEWQNEWPFDSGESQKAIIISESNGKDYGIDIKNIAEYAPYVDHPDESYEFVRRPASQVGKTIQEWMPWTGFLEDWGARNGFEQDELGALSYSISEKGIKNRMITRKVWNKFIEEAPKRFKKNVLSSIGK